MTDSMVAIIVVIVSAVVGPAVVIQLNARARRIERRLGTPNGAGNVTEMLTSVYHSVGQLLDGQTGQDTRLAKIDTRLAEGELRFAAMEARLDGHDRRLEGIEGSCSALVQIEEATSVSVAAVAGKLDVANRATDPQPPDDTTT